MAVIGRVAAAPVAEAVIGCTPLLLRNEGGGNVGAAAAGCCCLERKTEAALAEECREREDGAVEVEAAR